MTAHDPASGSPPTPQAQPRKAALAAWIGSALEYYDFFIYGSAAALIFPKVFFDESDPANATLLSLATFGVAYAARPVGALFLGHVGDRLGRKKIMVFTLMLMGLSTFLIGCLPTRDQIGGAAPVLLVILRIMQGISAAGEQASANSMSLEHAPPHRRGYFTSFTINGTQAGQLIATLAFIPVAALPEEQLLSWGWRIPFWLSIAVAVTGYVIRWALSYATSDAVGLSRTGMLWVGALANLVALFTIPLWARLSDRVGRRPVFLVGAAGSAVVMPLYLWAISTGSYPLVLVTGILVFGVVYSAANGIWPSFYAEMFPTRVRLSGMAIGTQTGFAIAGFAVAFASQIAGPDGDNWGGVALFAAALCVPPVVAALSARETAHVPTEQLGERGATPTEAGVSVKA
ncbi:MFS transporter [Streptomyces sp. wa22]|uniref:MFS transporter n=1 Tax=Streptomyces sp. wa22 TaxID=1828244 RepID=UPI0011CB870E|nr:MFS transporter [Streptomyces sp. wa22]TXS08721.1 MFS transporter [Streptomyces sp. wa22]